MQEKTLIQITDEIRSMMFERQSYVDQSLPVPPAVEAQLKTLTTFEGDKIDRCSSFVKMAEHQMIWLDSEIENLQKQKKKYADSIERLKEIAKHVMEENGMVKMEGTRGHSFSLRRSESVVIENLDKIPDQFLRKKIIIEADKNAIKAFIKDGVEINGAVLTSSYSVVIK